MAKEGRKSGETCLMSSQTNPSYLSDCTNDSQVVNNMEHVPWYFGCRYSCKLCKKVWHNYTAARMHFYFVHKLTRAEYEVSFKTEYLTF